MLIQCNLEKKKQPKHFQKMCAAEVSAESARAARRAVYLLSMETSVIGSSQTCDANCHHRIDFDNKRFPSERKSVFFCYLFVYFQSHHFPLKFFRNSGIFRNICRMTTLFNEDLDKICRCCLCKNGEMRPIFGSCIDNMLRFVAEIDVNNN